MAKFEEPIHVEIKLQDFEEIKQVLEDFKTAIELIMMYQQEIRNSPDVPNGFCDGILFREKLAAFDKYREGENYAKSIGRQAQSNPVRE